jgi:hypothetical protein
MAINPDVVEKIILPVSGALLLALWNWGSGKLNNAMTVGLTARRQKHPTADSTDLVVLELALRKEKQSRVRLIDCNVRVNDTQGDTQNGLVWAKAASNALKISLDGDFKGTDPRDGIALVPPDSVRFEAVCEVPAGTTVKLAIELHTQQFMFEWVKVSKPRWTSSVVVLPLA